MQVADDKFIIKKTAKVDVKESRFIGQWEKTGRYFGIAPLKKPSDKTPSTIRFYNIFGELIFQVDGLPNLAHFQWRPRPEILNNKQKTALRQSY